MEWDAPSFRQIFRALLRRKDLCPGPPLCDEHHASEDCPLRRLEEYMASPAAQPLRTALDLDFALQSRASVPLSLIGYPEWQLIKMFADEREKHLQEQNEERETEAQMQRAAQKGRF